MKEINFNSNSPEDTIKLGKKIGNELKGGETFELISDLGGGKTTFVSGIAQGVSSKDTVASPSFTISRTYEGRTLNVYHFDFYRLSDAGIMSFELEEYLNDKNGVCVVEWGDVVHDILPKNRIIIKITISGENQRNIKVKYPKNYEYLISKL